MSRPDDDHRPRRDADAGAGRADGAGGRDRHPEEAPPFWEWVVAGVGALLVLGSLGYLGWFAWRLPADGVPQPVLEVLRVEPQAAHWLVRVRVSNRGDATAEGLVVAGELQQPGQQAERSEVEFDFLPGRSVREATLVFARDPRAGGLQLRAVSWRKP